MNRLFLLGVFAFASNIAYGVVLQDFEGAFGGQGSIVADPADAGNKVLFLTGNTGSGSPGELLSIPFGSTPGTLTLDVYDFGATAWDPFSQNHFTNPGSDYGPRWGIQGDANNDSVMDNFWGAGIINKSFLNADQGYVYSSEVNTNSFTGSWFSPLFFSNPRRVKTSPVGVLPSSGNGLQDIGNGTPENPETAGTGAWTTWEFVIAAGGDISITAKAGTTGKYLDSTYGDDTQTTAIAPGNGSNLNVTNPQELWVFGGRNQADAGFGTLGTAGVLVDNIEFESAGGGFSVADFDTDGDVDGQDLLIWESSFGNGVGGDTDSDGDSDGADFLTWQKEYSGVSSLATAANIPEPSTLLLLALGAAGLVVKRTR